MAKLRVPVKLHGTGTHLKSPLANWLTLSSPLRADLEVTMMKAMTMGMPKAMATGMICQPLPSLFTAAL